MYKKTVIAEIKKDHGLVIDEAGVLHRINLKKGMRIGDRVSYRNADRYRLTDLKKLVALPKWGLAVLAAGAVFLVGGMGTFANPEPVTPVEKAAEQALPTADASHSVTISVGDD